MKKKVFEIQPVIQQNDPVILAVSDNHVSLITAAGSDWITDKVNRQYELHRAVPDVVAMEVNLSQQNECVLRSGQCDQERVVIGCDSVLDLHVARQLHFAQTTTPDRIQ